MTKDQEAVRALIEMAESSNVPYDYDQELREALPALKRLVDQGERGFCTYNGPCDYRLGRPITTDSKPAETVDNRSDVSEK